MEFVAMPDDERLPAAYSSASPPLPSWSSQSPTPHIYPHSHHGTPAQEYSGFNFTSPSIPVTESATYHASMQQPRPYPTLQPLVMPQWPSMLNQMSQSTYQPPVYPPPSDSLQSIPSLGSLPTLVSTTPTSRTTTTPRRTLTDKDRKDMCIYAEEHPNSKQTEIGAMFGVERSTVSKVLRQKEKYLFQVEEASKSPAKKQKPRPPDIERALAVWVKNQERKGVAITDELIREKARRFSATTSGPDGHPALSSSWIEKFKLRHNLMGARSRKSSLAPIDDESTTVSTSHSPSNVSPVSPGRTLSPPAELRMSKSQDSLAESSSSHSYIDYAGRHVPHHTHSTGSLNGAFSEGGPLSPASSIMFTPDSGTAASPFPQGRPIFPAPPQNSQNNNVVLGSSSQRPRSQTFPLLDQYLNVSGPGSEYVPAVMDSPMEEAPDPLLSINQIVHQPSEHHPVSIAPALSMRPPPLPAHIVASEGKRDSLRPVPSIEEARRAMEVVWEYFAQQPSNLLDMDESVYLGRLMDKVKLRSQSLGG